MFSNFSIDKLTDSIQSVAQTAQDSLNTAINNYNNFDWNDPETKLNILSKQHYLQELSGTINSNEISKLPQSYYLLEKKTDLIEKIIKKTLNITNTFSIDGYDYPPNLTESLSDWWNELDDNNKDTDDNTNFLPRSFAQALSNASLHNAKLLNDLNKSEKEQFEKNKKKDNDEQDDDDDEFEDDEDISNLIKIFNSWGTCNKNIDNAKFERDQLLVNEFNLKLNSLLLNDFKNVKILREKVKDSRLKFDTMRYELNKKKKQSINSNTTEPTETSKSSEETTKEEIKETKDTTKKEDNDKSLPVESNNDEKLLEKLEDDFVTNTSVAVETMEDITENTKILDLIKLFQNFQLVYYKQCIQEVENSMKVLTSLNQ